MNRRSAKAKDNNRDRSATSEDTVEAETEHNSQRQETDEINVWIDTPIKTYVDILIQVTTASIMQNIRQYMDQQMEVQREWNIRCMETINQRFAQLEQTNTLDSEIRNNQVSDNDPAMARQYPESNRRNILQAPNTERSMDPQEGNYPSTPVINDLIARIDSESSQVGELGLDIKSVKYKSTNRKYPALNYVSLSSISDAQGMFSKEATITVVIVVDLKKLTLV
ncbi:1585_t:CDS:1, partial [Cetraspora pellucida]